VFTLLVTGVFYAFQMICLSSLQMPSADWLKCVQDRFNWDCCPAWCDLDANSWHWGWQSFLLARGKTALLLYAICKAEHLLAFYIQSLSPGHTPPHILSAIAPMCLYWTVTWCCLWNFHNFAQQARLPYNRSTTFYYGGSQWLAQIFASLEQMQKQIADRRE